MKSKHKNILLVLTVALSLLTGYSVFAQGETKTVTEQVRLSDGKNGTVQVTTMDGKIMRRTVTTTSGLSEKDFAQLTSEASGIIEKASLEEIKEVNSNRGYCSGNSFYRQDNGEEIVYPWYADKAANYTNIYSWGYADRPVFCNRVYAEMNGVSSAGWISSSTTAEFIQMNTRVCVNGRSVYYEAGVSAGGGTFTVGGSPTRQCATMATYPANWTNYDEMHYYNLKFASGTYIGSGDQVNTSHVRANGLSRFIHTDTISGNY